MKPRVISARFRALFPRRMTRVATDIDHLSNRERADVGLPPKIALGYLPHSAL